MRPDTCAPPGPWRALLSLSLPRLQKRDVNPGIQTVICNSNHGTLNYLGLKAPECGSSSGRGPCILLLQGQLREWVNSGRPLPGSGKLFWGGSKRAAGLGGGGKRGKVSSVLRVVAESSVCIPPVPVVHWSAGTRTASHHVSKV